MTTEERLENWGECYRDRISRSTTSAFWAKYGSSPQREHWEYGQAPPVKRPDMNWQDADVVNGSWQSIPDAYHQTILGSWYVRRWSPAKCVQVACKAIGDRNERRRPTEAEFLRTLLAAHAMIERQLAMPAVFRMERLAARVREVLDLVEWRRMEAQPIDTAS